MCSLSTASLRLLVVATCLLALNPVLSEGPLLLVSPQLETAGAAGPWYVAPGGNDANTCTTPGAPCATIGAALNKPGFVPGDTILVAGGEYTGTGEQVVLLDKSAILSGGWNAGFTMQSGRSTIDGQGARRGVTVSFGTTAVIERFAVQNGYAKEGNGGGIYNDGGIPGNLTLNNSIVSGNRAYGAGGGIHNSSPMALNNSIVSGNKANSGGGIFNYGYAAAATLNNSTVSGNTASDNGGGIRVFSGTVALNNSTVSDNTAWQGGGIYTYQGGVILNNSTVSANTAGEGGGGIYNVGAVTLRNSILGGNTAGSAPDCSGTAIGSAGYNLIGSTSGCTFSASTGDLTNVDARLGLLIGSPGYLPLLPGSPAINAGDPDGCTGSAGPLTADQRGAARVGRCDIGAYEYTVPGPAASVHAVGGTPQTTPPSSAFRIPLRAAVLDSIGSPVTGTTVTFSAPASGASGTYADSGTFKRAP